MHAKRLSQIPPYLFAGINRKKAALQAQGVDVIDLGAGAPDRPAPVHILDALTASAQDPTSHRYPPYDGTPAFKRAVAQWYDGRFGVTLDPKREVLALIGSKEGLVHLVWAMTDPGDVVLVPDPGYPAYATAALMAGAEPVSMPLLSERGGFPDLEALPAEIVSRAKLLFLNYPNNPTGAIATLDRFAEVVSWARSHGVTLVHDAAYAELGFDGHVPPSILQVPGAKDVAVEFNSLSKSHGMAGFRIGMAVGNAEAIGALALLKSNVDTGVFKAVQDAAVAALTGPQDHLPAWRALYQERRDAARAGFAELGWPEIPCGGGFFLWLPTPGGTPSVAFAEELMERCGVIVAPGAAYGETGEGYFRVALVSEAERIREAIARMRDAGIRFEGVSARGSEGENPGCS
ncbi:LL-diaminopimelate aminotransferase [compost metagenome]